MAMADLVMPRLPDQQQSWFHLPRQHHHHQPTGHQRSLSYHMPQQLTQQQQPPPLPQQQQQQPRQPPSPYYHQTSSSENISPLSTSNNASPTSPRNYHGRQVRPLYMPAVLRPTEYPSTAQPPRASPGIDDADDEERIVRSSGSFTSLSGILTLSRLSRRSTGDSGKVVEWDWDLSNYPKVNGFPTRGHWKVRTTARKQTRPPP